MGRTAKIQKKAKVLPKTKSKAKSKVNNSKTAKKISKLFNGKPLNFAMNISVNRHNQVGAMYYDSTDLGQLAWEGRHQYRQQSFWINFSQPYINLPKITLAICSLNTGCDTNSRIYCQVGTIKIGCFQLIVSTSDDSVIYNLGISWLASGY